MTRPSRLKEAKNKLFTAMISAAIEKHQHNAKAAAEELGISPQHLNYYIRTLGLSYGRVEMEALRMKKISDLAHRVRPNQYEWSA